MDGLISVRDDGGIRRVQMRDATGRNALEHPMVEALLSALDVPEHIHVVLLFGLPDVFCSGASLATLQRLARGEMQPTELVLSHALLEVPVPVIAAMEGHAVGGGFAVGLCADIVLMAAESRYGCNFMDLGFTPGMGTTRLLEHVMSPAIAHELLYTGELRRGSELRRTGVNAVLAKSEVLARGEQIAARIAEKPRYALEMLKRTLTVDRRRILQQTAVTEALMHTACFSRPEVLARIEERHAT